MITSWTVYFINNDDSDYVNIYICCNARARGKYFVGKVKQLVELLYLTFNEEPDMF